MRCRKEGPPYFFTAGRGTYGFSINYCDDCILTTSAVQRLRGNGDTILAAHPDTPMNTFILLDELVAIENREAVHLERSKIASYEVNMLAKERRNNERAKSMKQFALQHGVFKGTHMSWGFGDAFDEYFGEVNDVGLPSGDGVKVYSDGSVYVGGWERGLRHSSIPATWIRPDGMQYEGTWVNDFKHGKGTQRFSDGAEYKGEFAKGYEHGTGIKTYPSGEKYEGRFRFGKRDGPGVLTSADGTVEKRMFRENDAVHEMAVPPVKEATANEDMGQGLFQPDTLLTLAVRALAKTMHIKRALVPSALLHGRLPEYFKSPVCRQYLETMHPLGSVSFMEAAPEQAFRSIPVVSLRHAKFQHYDAESFLYFISANSCLKTLELVNSRLDPTSIEMLCKTLKTGQWSLLNCLNLSFNRVDVTIVQSLLGALRTGAPDIQSLLLAGCQITPQGGALLAKYLGENPSLQDLDLAFNMIQAAGAERIAEALVLNSTLTKLNLRQNNIGTVGGEAMVEAMKTNLSLRVLCIADNKIGAHLACELSGRLRGTTKEVAESFRATQLHIPAIHLDKKLRGKEKGHAH